MKSNIQTSLSPTSFEDELNIVSGILDKIGFILSDEQPHLSGERFLMMRDKLVLLGHRKDNDKKVIIKASRLPIGLEEIENEKKARDILSQVTFSRNSILLPKEIYYGEKDGYLFSVTEFIPQEKVFAGLPLDLQFFLTLGVLESMEGFHAPTYEHLNTVKGSLPVFYARDYYKNFAEFLERARAYKENQEIFETLKAADKILWDNKEIIDLYCNYLTHTDLAPGNFKMYENNIYLLDLSSMLFGNKHEGWARFLNWALLHSRELEKTIDSYVKKNFKDEYQSLRMMRIYKAGYLIDYYIRSLAKTSGDLRKLTEKRIEFWHKIIKVLIGDGYVSDEIINEYKKERDSLRSKEEIERQKEFNLI